MKKLVKISLLMIILLLSISFVSAENITQEDDNALLSPPDCDIDVLTIDDEIVAEASVDEVDELTELDDSLNHENLDANQEDILVDSVNASKSLSDFANDVNNVKSVIDLECDYEYAPGDSADISIFNNVTINGNNHKIILNGSILQITNSNVILNNIQCIGGTNLLSGSSNVTYDGCDFYNSQNRSISGNIPTLNLNYLDFGEVEDSYFTG